MGRLRGILMIYVDTREKKNRHVLDYFERHGVAYEMKCLETADYLDPDRPGVAVDRKQNLDELASNLCTRDSGRFWREARRAADSGLRLVVLCEHGGAVRSLDDVKGWRSRHSRITGTLLRAKMLRVSAAYGVEFRFCGKRSTGKAILEILHEEGDGLNGCEGKEQG